MSDALDSRWFMVARRRVHVRVAGTRRAGKPAVLVHGVGVSSRYFAPTARLLARGRPVYAPDLPGFGLSEKPDHLLGLAALAEALTDWIEVAQLASPVVIGNSFGCQVAVQAAVTRPEQIGALVLQGPTVDAAGRNWVGQLGRWIANARHERPAQLPLIVRDYLDAGASRTRSTFSIALADRIEDKLPQVGVPTIVVRGDRDPICSQSWAEQLVQLLPNGRLAVVPDAAHTLNFAAPDAFVDAIAPLLEG